MRGQDVVRNYLAIFPTQLFTEQVMELQTSTTPNSELQRKKWEWRPKVRWFAAEYLIVVLGVLTAVGINAWWNEQERAAEETGTP